MTKRDYTGLNPFIAGMVEKLNHNSHKPGWQEEWISELFWGLETEVGELRLDIDTYMIADSAGNRQAARDALYRAIGECYDVGNYAYFLADKCKALLVEEGKRELDDGAQG